MKTTVQKVLIVSFGLGGHSEYYAPDGNTTAHLSGYDSPENWRPDEPKDYGHRREVYDYSAALVIDKRAVVEKNPVLAFKSPLLNVRLSGGEIDRCPVPSPEMAGALAESSNLWCLTLAQQAVNQGRPEPGPLDGVSPTEYAAWWKANGARVGTVNAAGRIVWEGGEVQKWRLGLIERAAAVGLKFNGGGRSWDAKATLEDAAGAVVWSGGPYSAEKELERLGAPAFA